MNKAETLKKISTRDGQLIRDILNAGLYCQNRGCIRRYYPGDDRFYCHMCWQAARAAIRVMRERIS